MSRREPAPFEVPLAAPTLDVVALRRLQVHCIIGVFHVERRLAQPLEVDVALHLDTRQAATSGDLSATVDYGRLAGELRFVLESAHFRLLETAAEALCRYVLAPPAGDMRRARVQAVTLRLTKPEALGGQAEPSLQVHRRVEEVHDQGLYSEQPQPFGAVDTLFEDKSVGLYRLRLAPGGATPLWEHHSAEVSELVLGAGLLLQGQPVAAGTGLRWPQRFPYRYDNPQAQELSVLQVRRPPRAWGEPEEASAAPAQLQPLAGSAYYPHASLELDRAPAPQGSESSSPR